jgi:hypothetical protein
MVVIHPFFNCICLYYMCVLWYKLSIVFTLKFMNVVQYMIYLICGISLLWPIVGGALYENALPTTIPYVASMEAFKKKKRQGET